MSAFSQITSLHSLDLAWRGLYSRSSPSSRYSSGFDEISINDFQKSSARHLPALHRELADGRYTPASLKPVLVQKANGKDRLICVPTVRDRIVQRALLDFLERKYGHILGNGISYGFIKGRSVKKAATRACALRALHPWAFKTDIEAFFDKIPRNRLIERITRVIKDRSIHPLLTKFVESEIGPTTTGAAKRISRIGIRNGVGVRQGMPLSPFFANLLLIEFDSRLVATGLHAVRYADDLLFLADSKNACEDALAWCKNTLGELELTIPELGEKSKSQICTPTEPVEFLGVSLETESAGYTLRVTDMQIQKMCDEILAFQSIPELVNRGIGLSKLANSLEIKVRGYEAAYDLCSNLPLVQGKLARSKDRALRKIFRDGLGINLDTITPAARKFLGL